MCNESYVCIVTPPLVQPKTQITPPSDPSSNVIGYNSDYDDDPNERHSYHLQPRIVAPFPATNIEARTQLTPAIRSPLFLSAIPSTAVVIASSPQGPRVTFATTPPTASVNPSTSPSANLLSVSARARISETVSQPVEAAPQFVYQRGGVRHDHNTVREDPAPSHIVELLTVKKKLPSIPVGKTSSDFPVLTPQTTSNNISQTVSLPPHNITVIDMPSLSENAAVLTSLLSVPVPSAAALKAHRCALLLAYLKGLFRYDLFHYIEALTKDSHSPICIILYMQYVLFRSNCTWRVSFSRTTTISSSDCRCLCLTA